MGAVGVDKATAEVDYFLATPTDDHTRFLGDGSDNGSLEVLLVGIFKHQVDILGVDDDSHTLLALTDSQFCTVKTCIFLGNLVEVDLQTVGQLANGDAYATSTEVVAFLDDRRHLFTTEQTLYLTFRRGVTLLHLSAAGGKTLCCVTL